MTNDTSPAGDQVMFSTADYIVMISSFLISTVIGSSYALCARKGKCKRKTRDSNKTDETDDTRVLSTSTPSTVALAATAAKDPLKATREYFSGGSLSFLPVTLSLVASRISPNTTIGFPVEVYQHGISIWFFVWGEFLGCIFAGFFCLPIFYPLEFNSIYEILERRYGSRPLRQLCSCLYVIKIVMYLGVVLYGPAIAISSVTPISIDASILTCGILCCIYTTLGGLRGVIWTDVFQIFVIIGAQIAILGLGISEVGGFSKMWRMNDALGRIKLPESRFDFHSRHSFWNIIVTPTLEWMMQMGAAQMAIQRLKGLPNMRQAVASLFLSGIGVVAITTLSMAAGLIVTSAFAGCDPLSTKAIADGNQYLPFLTMRLFSKYPGLTGLFVAAIFCATLSSISSGINAVANVIWDDFLRQITYFRVMKDRRASIVVRLISLFFGIIPVLIAFAAKGFGDNVQKMGTVLVAITTGAMNAIFIGCYFIKRTNAKGLMVGSLCSVVLIGWWVLGSTVYKPYVEKLVTFGPENCADIAKAIDDGSLPGLILQAKAAANASKPIPEVDWNSFPYYLYDMSYLWYQLIGTIAALVVAVIFSAIFDVFGRKSTDMDNSIIFSCAKLKNGLQGNKAKRNLEGHENLASEGIRAVEGNPAAEETETMM